MKKSGSYEAQIYTEHSLRPRWRASRGGAGPSRAAALIFGGVRVITAHALAGWHGAGGCPSEELIETALAVGAPREAPQALIVVEEAHDERAALAFVALRLSCDGRLPELEDDVRGKRGQGGRLGGAEGGEQREHGGVVRREDVQRRCQLCTSPTLLSLR